MAEEKDMTPPEAPESAEAAETAEAQVVETEAAAEAEAPVEAETPASPEPVEETEAAVEEVPASPEPAEAAAEPAAEEAPATESAEKPAAASDESEAAAPAAAPEAAAEDAKEAPAEGAPAEQDDAASPAPAEEAPKRRRMGASVGIAHIRATFNNTLVSISDMRGGVISWSSAGRAGFKGSRKSTAFAATMVGQDAARQAVAKGMHEVEVHVQGAGSGRESAIRALQTSGLVVTLIKDVTPMPHNGCRQRKRRRV